MLEYCKIILQKISFSKSLFKKEYKKSFKYLSENERLELKKWLKANVLTVSRDGANLTGFNDERIKGRDANMKLT